MNTLLNENIIKPLLRSAVCKIGSIVFLEYKRAKNNLIKKVYTFN